MITSLLGTQKTKKKQHIEKNPLESMIDIGKDSLDSLKNDLGKGVLEDSFDQLFDLDLFGKQQSGEMSEGQEIDLSQKKEEQKPHIEAAIDYHREIIHAERRFTQEEDYQARSQIEQIQIEIKKLMASSKELETSFKDVVMAPKPVKAGKYHVHFYAWVLAALRQARMKVEDSAACLSMVTSKSRKKNNYWGMFKKHGTSFAMSNERSLATQAG